VVIDRVHSDKPAMKLRVTWWWIASIVVHVSLMTAVARAVPPVSGVSGTEYVWVETVPSVNTRVERSDDGVAVAATATHERLGGATSAQNVSSDNPGERGDGLSPEQSRMLAARAEGVNLDARMMNNLDRSQEQRIRTSRERASPQDDRRTPNPADDPWVSTGVGVFMVRAHTSNDAPGRGATVSPGTATTAGNTQATPLVMASHRGPEVSPLETPRGAIAHQQAGVRDRTQGVARAAVPMATQRPAVENGHASTTSDQAALRPSDDADAALLAASLMRAHVNAAAQQGAARGEGEGGVAGGGFPGAGGGLGRGGTAHPMGDGSGVLSLETSDTRFVRYFGILRQRLQRLTEGAFPHEDDLQLRQGTVIMRFAIERDGSVRDVVIERRSGVAGYDANVRRALVSARMPPIPASVGRDRLVIRWPAVYSNPVVR
jgi:TonB family protein